MTAASPTISTSRRASLAEWLRAATPALLFGLRLWASVCVAFYVAFALELSEPSWAATTAALVCQPVLGASLRKSMFRMIGTVIGAIAIVVLAALFRQDRVSFLVGLALWCAASGFVATLLTQFCGLCRGARRLHRGDYCDRRAWAGRKHERNRLHLRHRSRARDLHRHCLRRRRARAHRSRTLATKARDGMRGLVERDHGWVHRLFCDRQRQPGPVSSASTRTPAARHRARSDDRRGDRRGVRPALSVCGAAAGGVAGLMETISAWRKVAFAIEFHGDATTRQEANAVHDQLPRARLSPDATGSTDEPAALRDACCSSVRSADAL